VGPAPVAPSPSPPETPEVRAPWGPAAIAGVIAALAVAAIVATTPSVWSLLGAGRGLVPDAYYPVSGFVLVLATTVGQVLGWAGGSALLVHVLGLAGYPATWLRVRLAMSVVYLGLAALPLGVYHVLAGGWLLGLPRIGLAEWLEANHPDARWLLLTAHPVIDLSLIPLAALFLLSLWGALGDARRSRAAQTVAAVALVGTSLAVALSLAIHSTLVHIRL
jgi:hypothetical protein